MFLDGESTFRLAIGIDEAVIRFEAPVSTIHGWLTGTTQQVEKMKEYDNGVVKECPHCKAGALYLSVAHVDGHARRYCRRCKNTFKLEVINVK